MTIPARALLQASQGLTGQGSLFAGSEDPTGTKISKLVKRTTVFASGLTRAADLVPAAWCEHPVGVEAGEMTARTRLALVRAILDYGCATFVDSGAYGWFRRKLRGASELPLDFGRILASYDELLAQIEHENPEEADYPKPLVVAPDVVGDQDASLRALEQHADWVRIACRFNLCTVIVPIQRGRRLAAEAYTEACEILGTDNFRVGVPSNAAAFTPDENVAFLREARPRELHILGAFAASRLAPRLSQIVRAGIDDDVVVSADGNPLRSVVISAGQGRDGRQDRLVLVLGRRARTTEMARLLCEVGGAEGLKAVLSSGTRAGRTLPEYLAWLLETTPEDAVRMAVGTAAPELACAA